MAPAGGYTTEICLLAVLGAGSPGSRCQQLEFLLRPPSGLANVRRLILCSRGLSSVRGRVCV